MSHFNATSTADDVIRGISLAGKFAVVTGASSGLGVETARVLSAAGAEVLLVARDTEKLQAVAEDLRQQRPGARLHTQIMDLADLDSVRAAAGEILQRHPRIHLLINNAGVMACPLARTAQGFEMQFGTNHMGHFLFTGLLAPALLAAAPGRVVNLSSGGHQFANFNFDDPAYFERDYHNWQAYGESKTANILFTVALDKRLRERGVRALAVHPGVILTNLGRHLQPVDFEWLQAQTPPGQEVVFKSVEQGSATTVWAATAAELEGKGGIYLEDCQIARPAVPGVDGGVESYALDAAAAERLWLLSEELAEQSLAF
jgi:NAD(P)-dependent dehydrogenase (short-subunit alcohol dehydrogenase family)